MKLSLSLRLVWNLCAADLRKVYGAKFCLRVRGDKIYAAGQKEGAGYSCWLEVLNRLRQCYPEAYITSAGSGSATYRLNP